MTDDTELLKKRLLELAVKAESGCYYTFSDFLGLLEQSAFREIASKIRSKYTLFGGVAGAQRIIVRFGDPEDIGYDMPFPIKCILISPKDEKFAENLSHRDYLGALMNLGIERAKLGDIVVRGKRAYLFSDEDIADYIIRELTKVRRTDVKLSLTEPPSGDELFRTERRRVQAQGERLDGVIAKLYSISREDSLSLFKKKLVFADGRQIENNSYIPKAGEVISVRGYGRFIYLGYETLSRKGKLNIDLDLYV
jgi:RNA-binding protein YlmH